MPLLASIHGILTRQTDPSWPDKLDAWMLQRDPEIKVLKKEYRAGPFPRWNCWLKDPLLARGLANEMELFLCARQAGRDAFHRVLENMDREWDAVERIPTVWFVAHSNGAVIALLAARRLIVRGHSIGGLILTGAACEADVERNGVLEWLNKGMLGAAIAYCSEDDAVLDGDPGRSSLDTRHSTLARLREWLWGKLLWPYGCLGRTGWLFAGAPLQKHISPSIHRSIFTRWVPGGHGTYFAPRNLERTFEQIYEDIKAKKPKPTPPLNCE